MDANELSTLSEYLSPKRYWSMSQFDLDGRLGRGSYGEVYRARCRATGCYVAIKKVEISEMPGRASRISCVQEVYLLQKLDHPNVIKYLGSFIEGSELNIVLELADGEDLLHIIARFEYQRRLMPDVTIWTYFVQLCSALDYVHSKRIMHRDIKPSNVLTTAQGKVKLCDIGVGRFFSSQTIAAYSVAGTKIYMSPEMRCGHGYDFKSDIWSLGCLLYEMATLQPPFNDESVTPCNMCKKTGQYYYEPLSPEHYSKQIRDMISMCLEANPSARPDASYVHSMARSIYKRMY